MACNDGSYGWGKRVTVRTRRKPCFFSIFFKSIYRIRCRALNFAKRGPRGRHAFARAPGTPIVFSFLIAISSLKKSFYKT